MLSVLQSSPSGEDQASGKRLDKVDGSSESLSHTVHLAPALPGVAQPSPLRFEMSLDSPKVVCCSVLGGWSELADSEFHSTLAQFPMDYS